MINISYNNLINKYPIRSLSFGDKSKIRNSDKMMSDRYEKRVSGKTSMSKDDIINKYDQVDKSLDMQSAARDFELRIKRLPMVMDRMMNSLLSYISGEKETDKFASDFVNDGTIIIKRAELGENAEEYTETYEPELAVIRQISPVCSKYNAGTTKKTDVDAVVEKSVDSYVKKDFKRKKNFLA